MLTFNGPIDVILFIIEVIGCISFATSGAICAIRKKADILGIWILTLIAIFGGGLLRDLLMNQYAPKIFYDPEYLILAAVSLVVATIWFLIAYFKGSAFFIEKHRHDFWIYLIDAIGVAVFVLYGVQAAAECIPEGANVVGKYIFIITMGVISGVGGGMFRDVFVGEIPMIFRKHFYMTPCILGCIIYTIMYLNNCNQLLSILVGLAIIVVLRVLATVFKWNLPVPKGYDEYILSNKNTHKPIPTLEFPVQKDQEDKKD